MEGLGKWWKQQGAATTCKITVLRTHMGGFVAWTSRIQVAWFCWALATYGLGCGFGNNNDEGEYDRGEYNIDKGVYDVDRGENKIRLL